MDAENLLASLRDDIRRIEPGKAIDPVALLGELERWETAKAEVRMQALEEATTVLTAKAEAREADAFLDFQIKLIAATFDKAVGYTNIVMIAGYASFFGIWSMVKDLNRPANKLAVLLMLVSVTIFVAFEFVKMAWLGRQHVRRQRIAAAGLAGLDPGEMRDRFTRLDIDLQAESGKFARFWLITVLPAALTALAGIAMLTTDLILALLEAVPT